MMPVGMAAPSGWLGYNLIAQIDGDGACSAWLMEIHQFINLMDSSIRPFDLIWLNRLL